MIITATSFRKTTGCRTRCHYLKLTNHGYHYDLKKCLQQELVISADTTKTAKIDKLRINQDLLFDYMTKLTGIENRSNNKNK